MDIGSRAAPCFRRTRTPSSNALETSGESTSGKNVFGRPRRNPWREEDLVALRKGSSFFRRTKIASSKAAASPEERAKGPTQSSRGERGTTRVTDTRSEEHTSELQSRLHL